MRHSWIKTFGGWLSLSRPFFHLVGILPFTLGTVLAWKLTASFNPAIFILGVIALILIMLSTYHAGEYSDCREDEISYRSHRNRFAGGSGVIVRGILPRRVALLTSVVSFWLAAVIGFILQFYFKTGAYTLLLGCLGAFSGFSYSMRPVRLVERGFGEIFIGFCYGWLTVASAYYIQTAAINPVIHWVAIPISLSIFNVILLNEYPDYEADKAAGKRNLLYRIGKNAGVTVYTVISILSWTVVFFTVFFGIPFCVIYFYLPFFMISFFIVAMMIRGKYKESDTLERLCGLNIVVNLGTSLSYLLVYILK
ncbi:MAG: prenyltransferase [Syntrophaceae bacterium]|nr:prenyltransferase [Syntrophaceae bacterium]